MWYLGIVPHRPPAEDSEYWSWWFVLSNLVVAIGFMALVAATNGGLGVEELDTADYVFGWGLIVVSSVLILGGIWNRSAAAAMIGIWLLVAGAALLLGVMQDHTNSVL